MSESTSPTQGPVVDGVVHEWAPVWQGHALEAVWILHAERKFSGDGYGWSVCCECRQSWPCATRRAIDLAKVTER